MKRSNRPDRWRGIGGILAGAILGMARGEESPLEEVGRLTADWEKPVRIRLDAPGGRQ